MCLSWTLQYILTEVLGPQQHPVPLPALKDALVPASQPAAVAPKMPVRAAPRETNAEPSVPGPASASVSSAHVPLAPGPSGKGKASAGLQLAVGYHDDQQKVWNGTCWSVSWKPAGDGSKYTDPAVAIFPDGSEYICTDILQGELTEKRCLPTARFEEVVSCSRQKIRERLFTGWHSLRWRHWRPVCYD